MDLSLIIVIVCAVLAVALVVVFLVFGRSEANFTFDIGGAAPRASGGADSSSEKTASSRLVGLAVGVGAVFSVLLARLWSMQLVSSEDYVEQAEKNRRLAEENEARWAQEEAERAQAEQEDLNSSASKYVREAEEQEEREAENRGRHRSSGSNERRQGSKKRDEQEQTARTAAGRKNKGGRNAKGPVGGEGFPRMSEAVPVDIESVTRCGDDWLVHGFPGHGK